MKTVLAFALVMLAGPAFSQYSGQYGCTEDCSGHEAGYAWAEAKGIDDPGDCCGTSGVGGRLTTRTVTVAPAGISGIFANSSSLPSLTGSAPSFERATRSVALGVCLPGLLGGKGGFDGLSMHRVSA